MLQSMLKLTLVICILCTFAMTSSFAQTKRKVNVLELSSHTTVLNGDTVRNALKAVAIKSGIFDQQTFNNKVSKNSASYSIETDGDYIRFYYQGGQVKAEKFISRDDGITEWNYGKVRVRLRHLENGVKEDVIVQEGGSLKHSWLIASNLERHKEGFGKYKIETPFTVDAKGDTLKTQSTIAWKDTAWWMDVSVDAKGAAFPIVIDPSVIDSTIMQSRTNHTIISGDATYLTARNETTADAVAANGYVGQEYYNESYNVRRIPMQFGYTIPAGYKIDSVVVKMDGAANQSNTDRDLIFVSSTYREPVDTSDFNKFIGWSSSGAYTTIKGLLDVTWNTSQYSNGWNYFKLRTDSVTAHSGDTLRWTIISASDSGAIQPSGLENVAFTMSGTDAPRLLIYLSLIPQVYAATGLNWGATTDSSAKLLNITLPVEADTTVANLFSIRHIPTGYWITNNLGSEFRSTETKLLYDDFKNITLPLGNNYYHSFEIRSWSIFSTDSLKAVNDTLLLGTVVAGDTVTVHDTTEVYYYVHDTITIVIDTMFVLQSAAVYDLISDSIGLARLEWRSNISDSLATVQPESLAYANLTGLDSAEFYVMGYDSTTGGTVLRKLKELLSYIGL